MYEHIRVNQKILHHYQHPIVLHTLSHHNNQKNLSSHSLTMPPKKSHDYTVWFPHYPTTSAQISPTLLARPLFAPHRAGEYVIPMETADGIAFLAPCWYANNTAFFNGLQVAYALYLDAFTLICNICCERQRIRNYDNWAGVH